MSDHDDMLFFQQQMQGVKPLKKTHTVPRPKPRIIHKPKGRPTGIHQSESLYFFSDDYEPLCNHEDVSQFLQAGYPSRVLKQLRRGDYPPELFLDLHGLTRRESKKELAALLDACLRDNIDCASVMHGFGKNILKQQVPQWLAQHPNVIAFHPAPHKQGGKAALWVLIGHSDFEID